MPGTFEASCSDGGSEFCNSEIDALLGAFGTERLAFRPGNSYDNVVVESTNRILEREPVHGGRFGSEAELRTAPFDWISRHDDFSIRLKARVEERMRITVMTSTGDGDYINQEEHGDLEYRRRQLEQMQNEAVDLEDVSGGVSITDSGLNEFRMDLVDCYRENSEINRLPSGINVVIEGDDPGIIFVLRNVNAGMNPDGKNRLHPFYVVRVRADGEVAHGYLETKAVALSVQGQGDAGYEVVPRV